VQFINNNSYNLTVAGTTTIGSTGQVGLYVNAGTVELVDKVTSAVGFIKSGDGVLRLDADNMTTLTGTVTLDRGEIRLQNIGATANGFTTGTGELRHHPLCQCGRGHAVLLHRESKIVCERSDTSHS
jgi:autotransporter-associated beta strand protein